MSFPADDGATQDSESIESFDPVSPRASLGPHSSNASGSDEQLWELVSQAFEKARQRNPERWRVMTVAVLKNRLLQLTERQFTEASYGATNMIEIASKFSDHLLIDESVQPPTVVFRESSSTSFEPSGPGRGFKVREDLWNGIVDYASGRTWYWIGEEAVADSPGEGSNAPVLPTLTENDMQSWRDEFASAHLEHLDDREAAHLERWRSGRGRTSELPKSLRSAWNERLKSAVADRINNWFNDRDEPAPLDLLVRSIKTRTPDKTEEPGSLRTFVNGCIAEMTDAELGSLALPSVVVHRYLSRLAG